MNRIIMASVAALAAAMVVCMMTGCEDSNSESSPPVNVSGTWRGSSTGDDPVNSDPSITMILTQSGNSLTGSIDGVSFSGSVNGNGISSTFQGGEGDTVTLEGAIDGHTMSGTWVSTTTESGTWTATKI